MNQLTVSVPEAARLLGISRDTAYTLAARGELPGALRLGRRFVVSLPRLHEALGIAPGAAAGAPSGRESEAAGTADGP